MNKLLSVCFLLAFTILIACKDPSTTTTPAAPTKAQLIAGTSSKAWAIQTAIILDKQTNISVDAATLKPCVLNMDFTFLSSGTFAVSDKNATKCDLSTNSYGIPAISSGKWTLSPDGTKLTIEAQEFKIVDLQEKIIKLQSSAVVSNRQLDVTTTFVAR